jgi:N-methylhydantoinase B
MERAYPVVVEGFGLLPDTAGPGRHRGSAGVYRQWRFLEAGHVLVRTGTPGEPLEGLLGGRAGSRSTTVLNPDGAARVLPSQTHYHLDVQAGDVIYHAIGGAAGHGDPWTRDPEAVAEDVRNALLGVETARAQYGVVIEPVAVAVDWSATAALRAPRARRVAQAG